MPLKLPDSTLSELTKLASVLSVPLYVVGGAVRDSLLGYTSLDIDIVSKLTIETLIEKLQGSPFSVIPKNKQFGTAFICGANTYEYTTFRRDVYATTGKHCPTEVVFVEDIQIDAERRDFTANAIYYDIKNDTFVDPLGGINDLKKRLLTAVKDPMTVLSGDALRLLRGVRLASALDLSIAFDTLDVMATKASTISFISKERLRQEFDKILILDTFYNTKDAHYTAVKYLVNLNMLGFIIPELLVGKGVIQRKDFHRHDVLEHNLQTFRHCDPSVRLAALLHDIGKPFSLTATGSMSQHAEIGGDLARTALCRLGYDELTVNETVRLVNFHMLGVKNPIDPQFLITFSAENADIYDRLLALQRADQLARF